MTISQERKLSMYYSVKDFLMVNATIVNTLPNFGAFNTLFNGYISQIEAIRKLQEADKTGIAKNKLSLKDDLVAKAVDVARKVSGYAAVTNNMVLAAEVDYTESSLNRSADTILRDKAQVIYDRANSNLAALASYGVTAAVLTNLQLAITAYASNFAKPKQGINDKKQATLSLADLFKLADAVLTEKMDKIVEVVRASQPVFYTGYSNARTIGNIGFKKLALKTLVKDAKGDVVGKANALLLSANDLKALNKATSPKPVLKKKTSDLGQFRVKSLASGSYVLQINKPGYKPAEVTVNIVDGETSEVVVVLERE